MKLENQVVSLDLAKRLKELGVKQESYFYWISGEVIPSSGYEYREGGYEDEEQISAFTVAELGEMLKETVYMSTHGLWKGERKWVMGHWKYPKHDYELGEFIADVQGETEADARAKMLIYLLENRLMDATEISKDHKEIGQRQPLGE